MDFAILSRPRKKCHFFTPIFGTISEKNKNFAAAKAKEPLTKVSAELQPPAGVCTDWRSDRAGYA